MAHNPQARLFVPQLAAAWHHVAMAPNKREIEKAEKEAALKKARVAADTVNVPIEKPVGADRQAAASAIAASSGPCSTHASTSDRAIIRFPDGEAAAKALGGEQLRVLMEAVADDVCKMLGALFTAADFPQILCQFAGISSPAGHPPLDIRSGPAGGLSSFKDPWCDDKAARSLDETGMYEAAANILWLHAFSKSTTISGDPPAWLTVVEIRDKEMIAAASAQVSVHAEVPRIVFPITVPAIVTRTSEAKQPVVSPGSSAGHRFLRVLSFEAYVWAFYLAMYDALIAKDINMVAALWQCCLTATVHVRVNLTRPQQALWSIACSETNKTKERVCSDSFPAFASKSLVVLEGVADKEALKWLLDGNVTFNGSKANKSMVAAILLFRDAFNPASLVLLRAMERRHGKDMLTSGYVKLARIVQLCSEHAKAISAIAPMQSTSDVVLFILEYLDFALRVNMLTPEKMTVNNLDKTRENVPGTLPTVFGRRFLLAHLDTLVDDMRMVPTAASVVRDLECVLRNCDSYTMYEKAFGGNIDSASAAHDANDGAESGNAGQPRSEDTGIIGDNTVETFKTSNGITTKVGALCCDFVFDLLAGAHDAIIKTAVQNTGKDTPWGALEIPPWQELHRVLSLQRSVVAADDGAPPVASTRVLRRYASAAERGDGSEGNAAADDAAL